MTKDLIIISLIVVFTIVALALLNLIKKSKSPSSESVPLSIEQKKKGFIENLLLKVDALKDESTSIDRFGNFEIFSIKIPIGYIIFMIILVLGIAVRVYSFGSVPPGLNQDEASGAYDAFSLANYGVDRNGDSFPVHLVAWGSGQNALYAYIILPIVKMFGLSEVTAASGNLIFGILTLIFLFFCIKVVKNMEVALISTLILAISPWHIMLSRWGLPENILPSIVMIGVFFYALSLKKPVFLLLSSVFMALSLYAYGTAYFVIPCVLLLLGLYELYFSSDKKGWFFRYTKAFIVFVVVSIPIILFIYINIVSPESESIKLGAVTIPKLVSTGTRYEQVVFLSGDYENIFKTLSQNFGYYYGTVFKQEGAFWNVVSQYGNIYHISNVFFFIGFIASILGTIRSFITRNMRYDVIFPIWFILGTLLGIVNETNTNRMNIIFIPMIYLVGYGIYVCASVAGLLARLVFTNIMELSRKVPLYTIAKTSVIMVVLIVFLGQFNSFRQYYFNEYPGIIGNFFRQSFKDAIEYTVEVNSSNRTVYVSNFTEAYVYVLFYTKYDPREFNKTVHYQNPNTEFRPVTAFGNYRFIPVENTLTPEPGSFYIVENDKIGLFAGPQPKNMKQFLKYTVLEF